MNWLTQRFELSRGGSGHDIRAMEGLRGFAVFLVFLVHYVTLVAPWVPASSALRGFSGALHAMGNTGVDLFFVLSGYLIYGSLISRDQPFLRFMSRRVERIYPAFLVVFVIYVGLSFAFTADRKIPAALGPGLAYLVENLLLLPGLFPIEPLITVAWSLSYEMLYYLAIPLVIVALGLRKRTPQWRVGLFAAAAVALALAGALYGGHVRLIMFISGILLFEAVTQGRPRAPGSGVGLAALVAGLLCQLLPTSGSAGFTLKISVLFFCFLLLTWTCLSRPTGWLPRAFSWRPVRWLGNMSYSYYLIHGLTLKAGFLVLGAMLPASPRGPVFFWALMAAMFVLTLVPSAILFLTIERPFSLVPRRLQRRLPASAVGSGQSG
ncbi:MAG TPA: acyltransferase [Albitalea sp.]|uniref:acyltransferase family protein n=1 Tax=Piscinibacter sp. TaxID=1903157 RepID=UPI002ED54AE8